MLLTVASGLLVGVPLGVLIHRSGFCMHSDFHQAIRGEPSASFLAYLLALGGQMVAVNTLGEMGFILVPALPLSWPGAVLGELLFGYGMAWARG